MDNCNLSDVYWWFIHVCVSKVIIIKMFLKSTFEKTDWSKKTLRRGAKIRRRELFTANYIFQGWFEYIRSLAVRKSTPLKNFHKYIHISIFYRNCYKKFHVFDNAVQKIRKYSNHLNKKVHVGVYFLNNWFLKLFYQEVFRNQNWIRFIIHCKYYN